MRRIICCLISVVVACHCAVTHAGGPCSGVKGGCHRSSPRTSARTSPPSTGSVHVDGYYRKDGTYVRPHDRHARGTATERVGSSINLPELPADEKPKQKYRTSARTTARSSVWNGTGSTPDDDAKAPAAKPLLPAKYVVHLTSRRKFEIADYREDKMSYWITLLNGGGIKYEKSMVADIEPIQANAK